MQRYIKRLVLVLMVPVLTLGFVGLFTAPRAEASSHASDVYIALGDSVAAGMGLPGGKGRQDVLCGRSSVGYPNAVARSTQLRLINVTCSGAKTEAGLYGPQPVGDTQVPAQIPTAFAQDKPSLVTLTIGANDVQWIEFIRNCYVLPCGSEWDTFQGEMSLARLRIKLFQALHDIRKASDGEPPLVLVNGYYNPFNNSECVDVARITSQEVGWLRQQTVALNKTIEEAASWFEFARFVPIDFSGHELCASAEPWIQDLGDPAPLHPTVAGEAAIARANIEAYHKYKKSFEVGR